MNVPHQVDQLGVAFHKDVLEPCWKKRAAHAGLNIQGFDVSVQQK
jgi:hypothetical protein